MANLATKKVNVVPMEWVGYRVKSDVIFAQVGYAILTNDSEKDLPTNYRIFTENDDYDGTVVESSDLFKFIEERQQIEQAINLESKYESQGSAMQITTAGASSVVAVVAASSVVAADSVVAASSIVPASSVVTPPVPKKKWTPTPQVDKGLRYIKQAEKDYKTADFLYTQKKSDFYNMVCFLSQQVAEKSLSGLLLALVGEDN